MDASLLTRSVTKRFPGVTALDSVDFELRPGEIHALMGENGAGKSTLIKVLTGVYPADSGEILLEGKPVTLASPADAVRQGVSTVYQEVNLAPNLSVAENLCIGREPLGPFGIKWKEIYRRAEAAMGRVDVKVDVRTSLRSCSLAVQQMVAIARALDVSAKVLILDEPTSSLDAREVQSLFTLMRRLRDQGLAILFVTHFLDQVYEVSDQITVLRNGGKVGAWPVGELPRRELVSQMIGRDAAEIQKSAGKAEATTASSKPFIHAGNLGLSGSVEGVNLDIRPGEIVGLAGLLGSGRTETIRLLYGIDRPNQGSLQVDGQPIRRFSPRTMIRRGVGLSAEDRKREGILPGLSLRENLILALQAKNGWLRRLPASFQARLADEYIAHMNIRPPEPERQIEFLSGGNQQKVLLARWLAAKPKALLLDEPTRGIDVGAKFEIMSLIEKLRDQGMGFLFVSSELSEVVRICSKVLVLRDRKAVEALEGNDVKETRIIEAIAESGT